MPSKPPKSFREALAETRDRIEAAERADAWGGEGSDQRMPIEILARVKRAGFEVELERARKIARRGE